MRSASWPYAVDFGIVSTVGLESSPVAAALARLRGDEGRQRARLIAVKPGELWVSRMTRRFVNHQLDFRVGVARSEDEASAFRTNLLVLAQGQRQPLHTFS